MADIRPFKGIRPAAGKEEKVVTLPYDVVSEDEVRKAVEANDASFFRIIRPEVNFPRGIDMHSSAVYEKAGEVFQEFLQKGILAQDDEDSFYLYTMEMEGRTQTGLVVAIATQNYKDGVIKRHELTREDKEQDRVNHLNAVNANTGPVYLLFNNSENRSFTEYTEKAEKICNFNAATGVRHELARITDEALCNELVGYFKERELYIADGHHRAASAARVSDMKKSEASSYFLGVIFPHNELNILPYNRVVKDLNGLSEDDFLQRVREAFTVTEGDPEPEKRGFISCYVGRKWYSLKPIEDIPDDPVEGLDVSMLQKDLLSPILGIGNPRTDERIAFVGGIKGTMELERLVNSGDVAVAFSLYPTGIEQLIDVSDDGGLMPPKSTWFEPKLMSGFVIHSLED